MGAIRYSCPIRLVPTYILPAKDIRLSGKFQADSFKTERLVCIETDGQTDMARSTRLVMLIKNIYTLWGRKRLLHCVANFWLKSIYPLQGYKNKIFYFFPKWKCLSLCLWVCMHPILVLGFWKPYGCIK